MANSYFNSTKHNKKEQRRQKTDKFIAHLDRVISNETNNETSSSPVKNESQQTLPSAAGEPAKKRKRSKLKKVCFAVPCSILDNAQTLQLKCFLAGQVARAASLFGVQEVVVFNDTNFPIPQNSDGEFALMGRKSHPALTLAMILQYLECPPYLRQHLFPPFSEFEWADQMNPLRLPHHSENPSETTLFREGITTDRPVKPGKGSYVNVGLKREVQVDKLLEPQVRVTVQLEPQSFDETNTRKRQKGVIVSPDAPEKEQNLYWGYTVRLAHSLPEVLQAKKYDLTIGTSDKGQNIGDVTLPSFKRMLIVFGGLQGLEAVVENDESITATNPAELFNFYLNTCPHQGSRTIRTEEAIVITLSALSSHFL